MNVHFKLSQESPTASYSAVQRTSELTGVGKSTIFLWKQLAVLTPAKPNGSLSLPSRKRSRKRKLFSNTKARSVIVMANASYHSVKLYATPSSNLLKKDVEEHLKTCAIGWDLTMLEAELLNLVNIDIDARPELEKRRVDA